MDENALDGFNGELVLLREVRWSKLSFTGLKTLRIRSKFSFGTSDVEVENCYLLKLTWLRL